GFASERRTNLDFVDTQFVDQIDVVFRQQRARLDGGCLRVRIDYINCRHATKNTIAQGFDDFTAFHQRFQGVALSRAAIVLGNDEVLGHVDQTTGQVTRVSRLQRRIGQTLTRTVSRDEVLQYVQPFTEVGGNRRFD